MKTCKGKKGFTQEPCSLRSSAWVGNGQSSGLAPLWGGVLLHFKPSPKDALLCHGGIPPRPSQYPLPDSFRGGTLEEPGMRQTPLWFGLARERKEEECEEEGGWHPNVSHPASCSTDTFPLSSPLQKTSSSLVCPTEGFVYSTTGKKVFRPLLCTRNYIRFW